MDLGTVKLSEYLNPQYCPKLYLVMFDRLEAKTQLPRSQALPGDAYPEALPLFFEAEPLDIGSQALPGNQLKMAI